MKLNHKHYGDKGEAVVILHGIFGMLDNWHSFASQLSKEYQVFTLDQRNHGRSPHSDVFDYPAMVGDLLEFLEDHDLDAIHLIGHSMGGKVAMNFALEHPQKIKTLTVLDIGIKYYPPRHNHIFSALCGMDLSTFSSRNEIDDYLSDHIHSFAIRQFLIKNIKRGEGNSYTWKMNLPVIRQSYEKVTEWIPVGKNFHGQSLFVRGSNSSYILLEDWPGIQELFPRAKLISIPGAGHWMHAEKPYLLLKAIRDFLSGDKENDTT